MASRYYGSISRALALANITFSSNVEDLVAATDHLRQTLVAPALIIGHSFGGAAVLAAAHQLKIPFGRIDSNRSRTFKRRPQWTKPSKRR